MTEDLHNDIDDLFRSGLEGKEDVPPPNVWAAISKGLPPTPPSAATPSVPGATPPPAAGGWTSTLIVKGIIGAAIVAVVGTAAYFLTSSEKPTIEPVASQTRTENRDLQQPQSEYKTRDAVPEKISSGILSNQSQAPNTENEPSDKPSLVLKKAENQAPVELTSDQKLEDRYPGNLKEAGRADETVRPEIAADRTRPGKMASGASRSTIEKMALPSSTPRVNQEFLRSAPNKADNRPSVSSVEKASVPASNIAERVTDRAKITIDRRISSVDRKAAPSFIIPRSIPHVGLTLPDTKTSEGTAQITSNKASVPLKRNDWRSKIYLTPVLSLNMTTMEIEENRAFAPGIGRAHIEFRETEDTRTTLSPGLIAGYAITPRISVQTGISELKNNISVSPKQIRAIRDRDGKVRYRMDCSSGSYFLEPKAGTSPRVGDSLKIASSEIRMRYVSIPLSVRVNFGNDRLRLFATAGTDINILAGKQTSTSLSASSSDKVSPVRSEGTRKQYLNGTLGAGIEIRVGKRLGIMLMPQYRFPLGNINEDGPVLTYPKTFTVTSGLRIGF